MDSRRGPSRPLPAFSKASSMALFPYTDSDHIHHGRKLSNASPCMAELPEWVVGLPRWESLWAPNNLASYPHVCVWIWSSLWVCRDVKWFQRIVVWDEPQTPAPVRSWAFVAWPHWPHWTTSSSWRSHTFAHWHAFVPVPRTLLCFLQDVSNIFSFPSKLSPTSSGWLQLTLLAPRTPATYLSQISYSLQCAGPFHSLIHEVLLQDIRGPALTHIWLSSSTQQCPCVCFLGCLPPRWRKGSLLL